LLVDEPQLLERFELRAAAQEPEPQAQPDQDS
jgi:hypothetical protein